MQYVALFFIVPGVNLLPAFGPPTWTVLVFSRLYWQLSPVALVVLGAIAAARGRYRLALGAHRFRGHLSEKRRDNLAAAREALLHRPASVIAPVAFFAISPLRPTLRGGRTAGDGPHPRDPGLPGRPTGQLLVYLSAASLAERHFGDILGRREARRGGGLPPMPEG
jgi:hypothetical protein